MQELGDYYHDLHVGSWWGYLSTQFVVSVEYEILLSLSQRILRFCFLQQRCHAENQRQQKLEGNHDLLLDCVRCFLQLSNWNRSTECGREREYSFLYTLAT